MINKENAASLGLLVLRVAFGCFMLVHGWQKLTSFDDLAEKFPDPLGLGSKWSLTGAVAAEFGCSLLLIAGLATRLAAIPLAFTMGVALFGIHADDPWKEKELAACYLAVYIAILLTGPGKLSIDHLIAGRRRDRDDAAD